MEEKSPKKIKEKVEEKSPKKRSKKRWKKNHPKKVRSDPRMVAQLRTTFLKLAAAMEGAMVSKLAGSLNSCIAVVHFEIQVRLGEAGSKELYPVSQYYSSTLVTYIRTVLQVGKKSVTCHFLLDSHLDQFNFVNLAKLVKSSQR